MVLGLTSRAIQTKEELYQEEFFFTVLGAGSAGVGTTDKNVESLHIDWFFILITAFHENFPASRIEMMNKALEKAKGAADEFKGTSDSEIYKKNTGRTSKQSSPENKTIVKTYEGEDDDSIEITITRWHRVAPWGNKSGEPMNRKVHRKDSAKVVDHYKPVTF